MRFRAAAPAPPPPPLGKLRRLAELRRRVRPEARLPVEHDVPVERHVHVPHAPLLPQLGVPRRRQPEGELVAQVAVRAPVQHGAAADLARVLQLPVRPAPEPRALGLLPLPPPLEPHVPLLRRDRLPRVDPPRRQLRPQLVEALAHRERLLALPQDGPAPLARPPALLQPGLARPHDARAPLARHDRVPGVQRPEAEEPRGRPAAALRPPVLRRQQPQRHGHDREERQHDPRRRPRAVQALQDRPVLLLLPFRGRARRPWRRRRGRGAAGLGGLGWGVGVAPPEHVAAACGESGGPRRSGSSALLSRGPRRSCGQVRWPSQDAGREGVLAEGDLCCFVSLSALSLRLCLQCHAHGTGCRVDEGGIGARWGVAWTRRAQFPPHAWSPRRARRVCLLCPKGRKALSLPSSDGSDGSTGPSDGPAGRIQYEVGGAGLEDHSPRSQRPKRDRTKDSPETGGPNGGRTGPAVVGPNRMPDLWEAKTDRGHRRSVLGLAARSQLWLRFS